MQIDETALPGVKLLTPRRFVDARGWFMESWSQEVLRDNGIAIDWVQDNHSMSAKPGTVRGLHYQRPPHAQAKLVRVVVGAVLDVVVDARVGSPTFGRWLGLDLSAENGRQVLIPVGFLHGFVTRAPNTEVVYKCSEVYASGSDGSVAWDDPDLVIDWGVAPSDAVLSDKDRHAGRWAEWQSPFLWEGAA